MKRVGVWLLLLLICVVLTAFSFARIDVPLARQLWNGGSFDRLNSALGARAILALEALVSLSLIVRRLLRGHMSRFAEALALACLASIAGYAINDEVLKPIFGVPAPADLIAGARHGLNWFAGSASSSFPSGHMVLASAFAGVFMSYYRASVRALSALLLLGAALLVLGDWHFVSDVIAGAFLGLSAGVLAGQAMQFQPPPNRGGGDA